MKKFLHIHTMGRDDSRSDQYRMENKEMAVSGGRVSFALANAEEYPVPENVDCIYFFNPFSLEILQKAVARILNSYYDNPRERIVIFEL